MCWRRSRLGEPVPPAMESDIFEHFALEVFRNLFAFDVPSIAKGTSTAEKTRGYNATSGHKDESGEPKENAEEELLTTGEGNNATLAIEKSDNATGVLGSHHHRRNGTRMGLNSDLSKYGPWGYLMLGMLLCGGALLICGLWGKYCGGVLLGLSLMPRPVKQ